jgi:protein CpxP
MRRLAIIASLLVSLSLSSVATLAAGPQGRHGIGGRMAEQLKLTDEQKERLRAIHEEAQPAIQAARENVRAKREALDQAVTASPVDRSLVEQRVRELGEAETSLLRATTAVRLAANEVLTPEQRETLRSFREERRERRREGRPAKRLSRP